MFAGKKVIYKCNPFIIECVSSVKQKIKRYFIVLLWVTHIVLFVQVLRYLFLLSPQYNNGTLWCSKHKKKTYKRNWTVTEKVLHRTHSTVFIRTAFYEINGSFTVIVLQWWQKTLRKISGQIKPKLYAWLDITRVILGDSEERDF